MSIIPSRKEAAEDSSRTLAREAEAQWILRSQSGDAEAFRRLVERYEERAFWIAYRLVGHVEDAQDIVQEAFVRVHQSLGRFRVGRPFYTWFYRIVLHLAIDSLRRRRERVRLPDESLEPAAADLDPLERLARDDFAARVQSLLRAIPPRERAILVLRDIEGFSSKEIAEIAHSNQATVRWWVFMARKRFRMEWERRYGGEDPCA